MATERQTQELVARCVSLIVFYAKVEKTQATNDLYKAEIETIGNQMAELDLDSRATDERILQPLLAHLLIRYTPNIATGLLEGFLTPLAYPGKKQPVKELPLVDALPLSRRQALPRQHPQRR